jgi:hypothetical protein
MRRKSWIGMKWNKNTVRQLPPGPTFVPSTGGVFTDAKPVDNLEKIKYNSSTSKYSLVGEKDANYSRHKTGF